MGSFGVDGAMVNLERSRQLREHPRLRPLPQRMRQSYSEDLHALWNSLEPGEAGPNRDGVPLTHFVSDAATLVDSGHFARVVWVGTCADEPNVKHMRAVNALLGMYRYRLAGWKNKMYLWVRAAEGGEGSEFLLMAERAAGEVDARVLRRLRQGLYTDEANLLILEHALEAPEEDPCSCTYAWDLAVLMLDVPARMLDDQLHRKAKERLERWVDTVCPVLSHDPATAPSVSEHGANARVLTTCAKCAVALQWRERAVWWYKWAVDMHFAESTLDESNQRHYYRARQDYAMALHAMKKSDEALAELGAVLAWREANNAPKKQIAMTRKFIAEVNENAEEVVEVVGREETWVGWLSRLMRRMGLKGECG